MVSIQTFSKVSAKFANSVLLSNFALQKFNNSTEWNSQIQSTDNKKIELKNSTYGDEFKAHTDA
jgi:hypothetical protein